MAEIIENDTAEALLEIVNDESKDDEQRHRAAYMYGLLSFAERIDEKTVRINKDTHEKLATYIAILRLSQELKERKK